MTAKVNGLAERQAQRTVWPFLNPKEHCILAQTFDLVFAAKRDVSPNERGLNRVKGTSEGVDIRPPGLWDEERQLLSAVQCGEYGSGLDCVA